MEFINLKAQYEAYEPEIQARIQSVLQHGQFIMGPEIAELEQALADYVGVKHAITVASGTDSLEIALRALNIGPGDEVITVTFSWISTAEVILQVGATPVFVDIDPQTYLMDVSQLEEAITPTTKAIIPVSLYGQMPQMEQINALADKHGIAVIEDAAQSFGATRNGEKSGGASLIGSTSFFPAKPFGCYGDGGALFTNDDTLAESMRAIRTHGGVKRHHHTHVGMNGRLDTLQAAIMLAKWPHFAQEVEKRATLGARYNEALKNVVHVPEPDAGNTHVYGQYTIRVEHDKRVPLQTYLKEHGIPTGIYYPVCMHQQPVFQEKGFKQVGQLQNSIKATQEVLSLPMSPFLTEEEQDKVIECIRRFFS